MSTLLCICSPSLTSSNVRPIWLPLLSACSWKLKSKFNGLKVRMPNMKTHNTRRERSSIPPNVLFSSSFPENESENVNFPCLTKIWYYKQKKDITRFFFKNFLGCVKEKNLQYSNIIQKNNLKLKKKQPEITLSVLFLQLYFPLTIFMARPLEGQNFLNKNIFTNFSILAEC